MQMVLPAAPLVLVVGGMGPASVFLCRREPVMNLDSDAIQLDGDRYVDTGHQRGNIVVERHVKGLLARYVAGDPDFVRIEDDVGLEFEFHPSGYIHSEIFRSLVAENRAQGKTVVEREAPHVL